MLNVLRFVFMPYSAYFRHSENLLMFCMKFYRLPFAFTCVFFLILAALTGCMDPPPKGSVMDKARPKVSFKAIHGIAYTEVRREYENGLGFHPEGYHLEPEWQITFLSEDTVRIYSIVKQRFIKQWVAVDHDSVANIAHSWVRVMKITPDSLKFQVLYVVNQKVDNESKGQIFMTLYSNNYIKNVLHTTVAALQKAPRRDSVYIAQKTKAAAADYRKAFAATQPVVLESRVPQLTITKEQVKESDELKDVTLADNYLSPTFNITIHKSYADFDYYMQVIVDNEGKMHFIKSLNNMYDGAENRLKVMKGIVDGYLTYYIKTKPGKTLGMPHASYILVRVKGIKD
jgi:hypothetical protein